jgi:hypothetical protein
MRGLAFRRAVCAVCLVLGLSACAAKGQVKQIYAVPEGTTVRLKEPCKIVNEQAKGCKFVLEIKYVVAK